MGERSSGDFGRRLRDARERRGISLRQIADATKIGVASLEALERNDFSRLPGGIFSRAFVRSYAVHVGLDPDDTIQQFLDSLPRAANDARSALLAPEDHEAIESDRRIAATFVRLATLALPIAMAIVYFGSSGRPGADFRADAEPSLLNASSRPAAAAPAAATPAVAVQPVQPAAPAARRDVLIVGVAALAECWVAATIDGSTVMERLMTSGERQTLEVAGELRLTVGDAAALALTIEGAPLRPLGDRGQVVTLRLNRTNFKEYLANP
jgi:cytoskeletal protein RodZ